ncbi:MAG: prepilin peptidase [Fimbriiglobus sp.]|nr:prepilin peptidase [Fimbriiglobus sp.]
MDLLSLTPYLFLTGVAFVLGLMVGSFLNVLVARMPYDKSVVWPSSRCFACFRPIRWLDNVPILGYLRLRGQCRRCGATFSARYLWVELFTGLAFAIVFVVEAVLPMQDAPWGRGEWLYRPGLRFSLWQPGAGLLQGIVVASAHCFLLAALIASAVIDGKHRIIPLGITYTGTLVGLVVSTACPWPWPNPVGSIDPQNWALGPPLPLGVAHWPFWGPLPGWAPAGSPQLGLLTSLIGAAVGMTIGRAIKTVFEFAMGREALGIGDADLLMMSGAFLGWQVIALALPVAACLGLLGIIPKFLWAMVRRRPFDNSLAFGPWLAAGVVTCWFGWPWLGELVRAVFFDGLMMAVLGGLSLFGLLIAGLLLRRKPVA